MWNVKENFSAWFIFVVSENVQTRKNGQKATLCMKCGGTAGPACSIANFSFAEADKVATQTTTNELRAPNNTIYFVQFYSGMWNSETAARFHFYCAVRCIWVRHDTEWVHVSRNVFNSNSEEARATAMQCTSHATMLSATATSYTVAIQWQISFAWTLNGHRLPPHTVEHKPIVFSRMPVIHFGGFDAAIVCNFLIIFEWNTR